jgi:hypothetical protein
MSSRLKLALKDKADEDVLLKHFDEAVHFYEAALELEPPDAITNRATSIISSRQSAMALHSCYCSQTNTLCGGRKKSDGTARCGWAFRLDRHVAQG